MEERQKSNGGKTEKELQRGRAVWGDTMLSQFFSFSSKPVQDGDGIIFAFLPNTLICDNSENWEHFVVEKL